MEFASLRMEYCLLLRLVRWLGYGLVGCQLVCRMGYGLARVTFNVNARVLTSMKVIFKVIPVV